MVEVTARTTDCAYVISDSSGKKTAKARLTVILHVNNHKRSCARKLSIVRPQVGLRRYARHVRETVWAVSVGDFRSYEPRLWSDGPCASEVQLVFLSVGCSCMISCMAALHENPTFFDRRPKAAGSPSSSARVRELSPALAVNHHPRKSHQKSGLKRHILGP
jgi:hypothetical protein